LNQSSQIGVRRTWENAQSVLEDVITSVPLICWPRVHGLGRARSRSRSTAIKLIISCRGLQKPYLASVLCANNHKSQFLPISSNGRLFLLLLVLRFFIRVFSGGNCEGHHIPAFCTLTQIRKMGSIRECAEQLVEERLYFMQWMVHIMECGISKRRHIPISIRSYGLRRDGSRRYGCDRVR